MQHTEFMREAIRLAAEHSVAGEDGPFGAVVVHNRRIVGRGWNGVVSIPDPTAHAEIMAIRQAARLLAAFDLSACQIYASCQPCPMCLGAIYWARIPILYYAADAADAARAGFDDAAFHRQMQLAPEARSLRIVQTLRDEALPVFERWLANPKRRTY